MKKVTFKPFLFVLVFSLSFGMFAQNNLWNTVSRRQTQNKPKTFRKAMPQEFHLFSLNTTALKSQLSLAPKRFGGTSNVVIQLPTNQGELQNFRVYEASVMEPALQAAHPNIRSYAAQGIDDPSAVARFSVSNDGVHVMISSPKYSTVYIDPYTQDKNHYIVYNISSLPADPNGFECFTETPESIDLPLGPENADDGMLRTYRLALACTGEYAQYHLNQQGIDPSETDEVKKAAVLSAMNTTMTRVNGVYEREVAVTMVIIADNTDIIYLVGATDPYTNNNGFTMLSQNQSNIDAVIGSANYDIGHVFSTGGGGIAGLGVVCIAGSKARGVTGLSQPIGDFFDIDYVAHEMGHQYRANHTFNNSCGNNRNNATAVEPGSGSTIMAYAGICPPNVQAHSDDYFTAISIQEIWSFISVGGGQCAVQTPTNNNPPTADAGPNYTIPASTPFILKGIATDPDSDDALSYCWEQMDVQVATMPPQSTSTGGPAFRTNSPIDSPDRYMPELQTVLNNLTQSTWEVVPSVSRNMNFRFTVRDNVAGGASSASDNMTVTVDGDSGPFVVTSQDTPSTWTTGTTETITWEVAGTDVAPVDSPTVDIWFSTDGGLTYPVSVALNVPNTGSAEVNVPNLNTETGRLMVISSNNIFYDLNDDVITVEGEILSTEEVAFENFSVYPNPSNGTFNLSFMPVADDKVEVALYDLRGRAITEFTFNDVSTSGLFKKQLNVSHISKGMYFLVVKNGNKEATKKIVKN